MTLVFRPRPGAGTLFTQVLALVLIALAAAEAINVFIIFNLPQPTPSFYTETEIVQALRGAPLKTRNGPPLSFARVAQSPSNDPDDRRGYDRFRMTLAQSLKVAPGDIIIMDGPRGPDRRVYRMARERLGQQGQSREEPLLIAPFRIAIPGPAGQWTVVQPKGMSYLAPWQQRLLLWYALSAVAVVPLVYMFARRLAAPFASFAAAAERLGRDPRAPPLTLRGSSEIDKAVMAFNDMQDRLRRYVEDRVGMIGAIAHDLRTPLTRLRFRVEAAPEDQRAKMNADIDQMEAMISATLAFVRDSTGHAERTQLELSSLLESIADDMADTGATVSVERADRVVLEGDSLALRRLLTNLLDNAIKFGGAARARLSKADGAAVIEIDDDGPGVPERDLERVFDPFYRREPSRSRATGGIGLGLSVVRSIARAHGGEAVLVNRPGGGLTARVSLPI